ncbi:MAG: pyridoxamine 5'-phosphate oxidase family protein [Oscillospiraceae bacterium]|jgi:uncharacterized pyridoxamine 5'-phosphate oxidase family protein|nr:pyridoxamine 5'-phosphate oxidase family protein [Oscillospiraceae bacterium]
MANKATEYLQKVGTFFIATTEGDQPRVRPFGAVGEFDGKTYICLNNTKKVFAQLVANPKIEIVGQYEGGNWVRIWAKAVRDDRNEAREKMLELNEGLRGMYKADDGIYEVFYLDDAHGKAESFAGSIEEF